MKPNIDSKGRLARGALALIFFLLAAVLFSQSLVLSILFALAGLFTAFEALRSWCAVRACGIRTPF